MAKIDEYLELAKDAVEADESRDKMFMRQDKMWRMEWDKEAELRKLFPWMHPIRSSDAHDSLRGVQRILSKREPAITVWPASDDPVEIETADRIEKSLKWFWKTTLQKSRSNALADIVMSAARYDEVTGQVIFIPYQKDLLEGFLVKSKDKAAQARFEKRAEAMEKAGPFSIIIRNPLSVHATYSEYVVEQVVYASVWTPTDIVNFYGASAQEMQTKIDTDKAEEQYAVIDITDHSNRFTFAIPVHDGFLVASSFKTLGAKDAITILDKKNTLGFIPWICTMGGTELEPDEAHKRIPMLYSIDQSGQYDTQNLLGSIVVGEAISHAAAARRLKSGPGAEDMEVNYGDPALDIVARPGQDYKPLERPQLDQALFQLYGVMGQQMQKSTLPPVLQGGAVPSQTFSTLNLAVQSGMVTIDPYKRLGERWVSEACLQMLEWVRKHGEPVTAMVRRKNDAGDKIIEKFQILPSDLGETTRQIDVEFQAETPVNKPAMIQGASLLKQLGAPTRVALEEAGETNARGLMEEATFELLEKFFLQRIITRISAQDQMNLEKQKMDMQT